MRFEPRFLHLVRWRHLLRKGYARGILVSLAMASCLLSCRLQQPRSFSYLESSKVHIARDSSSITCLLPEAIVTFPIGSIRQESFYASLLITTTPEQFKADRYWYRDMGTLPKKYLNGNAQMLFSLSSYVTAYLVDAAVQHAVKAPIHGEYVFTQYDGLNRNSAHYEDYFEGYPDYGYRTIFRTIIENPRQGNILLIDQRRLTDSKTLVVFYLYHSDSNGCRTTDNEKYGYQIYLGRRAKGAYKNPFSNRCRAYQSIATLFDPILGGAEIEMQE